MAALHRSRSGQRLRVLQAFAPEAAWHFDNTTPECGDSPDSVIPPDFGHIQNVLTATKPDVVIACGRQAKAALLKLELPKLLIVPHPAHRLLTNALYRKAGQIVRLGFHGICELRQRKGRVQFLVIGPLDRSPLAGGVK